MNTNRNTPARNRRTALVLGTFAAIGLAGPAFACDPADFDMSGHVGLEDLAGYLSAYLAGDKSADFNADGKLTVQDIFDFVGNWITRYIEDAQAKTPIDTPTPIKHALDGVEPLTAAQAVGLVGIEQPSVR